MCLIVSIPAHVCNPIILYHCLFVLQFRVLVLNSKLLTWCCCVFHQSLLKCSVSIANTINLLTTIGVLQIIIPLANNFLHESHTDDITWDLSTL